MRILNHDEINSENRLEKGGETDTDVDNSDISFSFRDAKRRIINGFLGPNLDLT